MADTMQFDLVSPERSLASLKASAVQLPGSEGDMTAMPDHAPVITNLRPGIVRVSSPDGDAEFVVTSGFAEINQGGVSVIAEKAMVRDAAAISELNAVLEQARKDLESALGDDRDAAEKFVAELVHLLEMME